MDYTNNDINKEEGINIRRFIIKVLANWPLFILFIGIAYIIAFLVNRYTEPLYSVSTTVLISDEKKTEAEMLIPSLGRLNTRLNVENEMAVIKSFNISYNTVLKLDLKISYYIIGHVREPQLYKTCPFDVVLDTSNATKEYYPVYITILNRNEYLLIIDKDFKINKRMKFGQPFHHPAFNFTIYLNENALQNGFSTNKYFFIVNNTSILANQFRNKLSIGSNEKRGSLVTLVTVGAVPQIEVDYLNKLCEVYIKSSLEEKNRAAINTIIFIDDQLSVVSDSLKKTEMKLQNFRLENKIVNLEMEGTAVYNRTEKLQEEKVINQVQLNYYHYLKKYIDDKKDFRDIIAPSLMGISEPVLNEAIAALANLYEQKAVLGYSAQSDNPALSIVDIKIKGAIDALKENIKEMINSSEMNNQSLENRILLEDQQFEKLPVTERKLINIQREYDLNNNIFTFLLQKRAEAGISKASNVADSKVIDQARIDNAIQISPKRSKNYMIALFIGILIPLVIIFLIEIFNTRITDLTELEKLTKCNILGSIGHNEKESELPVFENPKSSLSESFRGLRTNLQYLLRDKEEKVIVITSTISGEGKTFCAVNLACILALSNKKTLLISLDLRKPKIHKIFNLSNDVGLSTYLIKRELPQDIIFTTNIKDLYITTSGPIPPNPAELLETKEMDDFIKYARKEFDYIVLDTPPVAIVTDALLLSRQADTTIFVIRQNYSSKEVLKLADDLAQKSSMKHLCILVNDVRVPGYYGYSYKYGYRYGYGYNYNYGYNYTYGHDYYGESLQKPTWKDKLKRYLKII